MPVEERALGPQQQQQTLADRGWLARFTGEAGDPAAARDQLAELVAGRGSGCSAQSTQNPGHARQPGLLERGGRGRGRGPVTSSPNWCRSRSWLALEHQQTLADRGWLARSTGEADEAEAPG